MYDLVGFSAICQPRQSQYPSGILAGIKSPSAVQFSYLVHSVELHIFNNCRPRSSKYATEQNSMGGSASKELEATILTDCSLHKGGEDAIFEGVVTKSAMKDIKGMSRLLCIYFVMIVSRSCVLQL